MIYDRISNQTQIALFNALGVGREYAKHGEQLAEETGIDARTIKLILEGIGGVFDFGDVSYAVAGHPAAGYYVINTEAEWQDELRRMRTRALKQLRRLSNIKRAHQRRNIEQPQQPPVPEGYQFALLSAA